MLMSCVMIYRYVPVLGLLGRVSYAYVQLHTVVSSIHVYSVCGRRALLCDLDIAFLFRLRRDLGDLVPELCELLGLDTCVVSSSWSGCMMSCNGHSTYPHILSLHVWIF